LKIGPKAGSKSAVTDDIKLKLAEHISSDLVIRHLTLISRKRNKAQVMDEPFQHIKEYINPITIHKPTLSKWLVEIMDECVEWEKEFLIMKVRRRKDRTTYLMSSTKCHKLA
jgi:hypothetical protein